MRSRTLLCLFLAALLAAGCSSSNAGKIEGTKWTSLRGTIRGKEVPDGALTLEFGSDGKLVYTVLSPAGEQTYSGKYSLSRGDYVVMRFDQTVRDRKVHTERIVIDGDKLTMTDSDGKTSVTFKPVKVEPKED